MKAYLKSCVKHTGKTHILQQTVDALSFPGQSRNRSRTLRFFPASAWFWYENFCIEILKINCMLTLVRESVPGLCTFQEHCLCIQNKRASWWPLKQKGMYSRSGNRTLGFNPPNLREPALQGSLWQGKKLWYTSVCHAMNICHQYVMLSLFCSGKAFNSRRKPRRKIWIRATALNWRGDSLWNVLMEKIT